MNQKIFKIIFVLLLIFTFSISYVLATDINLDLPSAENTENVENTENNLDANNSTDNTLENLSNTEQIENTNNDTSEEVLQPQLLSSANETGLTTTNIINILLITVGVILVLLAIAILIRLKK